MTLGSLSRFLQIHSRILKRRIPYMTMSLALTQGHSSHSSRCNFSKSITLNTEDFGLKHRSVLSPAGLVCPVLGILDWPSGTNFIQRRYKSKKRKQAYEQEESDSDSDMSDNEFPEDIHFDEDDALPNNFTEKKIHIPSLRADGLLAKALNVGRHKVDEHFLDSKLNVNGQRLLKKSIVLNEGDYIDWRKSSKDGKVNFTRVRIVLVSGKKSKKGNLLVHLRIWENCLVGRQ